MGRGSALAAVALLATAAVLMAGEPEDGSTPTAGPANRSNAQQDRPPLPTELVGKARPKQEVVAGPTKPAGQTVEVQPTYSPSEEPPPSLYQELIVAQKSNFRIQGLDSTSGLRYGVLSSFAIEGRSDGGKTVHQKVEAAKLIEADALTQDVFKGLLKKLEGTTFRLTFNPRRELTELSGGKDAVHAAAGGDGLSGATFMMASLVDQDGWKELGQLSFFQPTKPLRTAQHGSAQRTTRGDRWAVGPARSLTTTSAGRGALSGSHTR